jgi:hypothetical protein
MRARIEELLFRPVDIASLAVFRVMFGLLMAYDTARYVTFGWVRDHYIDPPILLKYPGFHWVEPLPLWGLHAVHGAMVAAGICIALGLFYRLSCVLFFLGHTYAFFLAAAYYLNHAYLISVFSLLMVFVPAQRALSLDATRRPGLYSRKIPAWPLILLGGLLFIVFVYGGIAKLNADWFAGEPLRHWLGGRARSSIFGDVLASEPVVLFVCWAGAAYDLAIGPALVWRRTRTAAVVASLSFHLTNAYLFNIGIFPWFMLAATTLFFHPSWPRKLPWYGKLIDKQLDAIGAPESGKLEPVTDVPKGRRWRVVAPMSAFFVVMLLLPVRHHLYPGTVAWSEEGHYFSWRMKLRHKEGRVEFVVTDPSTGHTWTVDPSVQLTERQVRKMTGRPDLMLQYAHYLRDGYAREHGIEPEVRVNAFAGLNYRPYQRFIDPDVDLAKEEISLMPYTWIVPFEDKPLPARVAPAQRILHLVARRIDIAARGRVSRAPEHPPAELAEE